MRLQRLFKWVIFLANLVYKTISVDIDYVHDFFLLTFSLYLLYFIIFLHFLLIDKNMDVEIITLKNTKQ